MRPLLHWAFRVAGGVIFDGAGSRVSRITLLGSGAELTSISFSPGIMVTENEHKESTVVRGNTVSGKAYLAGGRPKIVLADGWPTVLQRTSCGPNAARS